MGDTKNIYIFCRENEDDVEDKDIKGERMRWESIIAKFMA